MPVRVDRFTSIKKRLRQGAENFDFGALIEGVSTLEETESHAQERAAPFISGQATVLERPAPPEEIIPDLIPQFDEPAAHFLRARHAHSAPAHRPAAPPEHAAEQRLTGALRDMILRLNNELSQFATLLSVRAVEPAGACLANINRTLELLASIDPHGEQARRLNEAGAPPPGKTWPVPAWSVVGFAESPLSGLLPDNADEEMVRGIMYAAWGVTFE